MAAKTATKKTNGKVSPYHVTTCTPRLTTWDRRGHDQTSALSFLAKVPAVVKMGWTTSTGEAGYLGYPASGQDFAGRGLGQS
jgi:hypothetical protein